jgi:Fe-S-cluster containining protein
VITDLIQIERLGEKRREENFRLRTYLKTHKYSEPRLRKMAQTVQDQIDCRQCANCCRVATTTLQERDVEKLARYLGLRESEFLAQYTEVSEEEGLILKRTESGCVFLNGNDCTVYEKRPDTCVHFPHLTQSKGSLASRMWSIVDRASMCPIVYNTLEAWKDHLGFRRIV